MYEKPKRTKPLHAAQRSRRHLDIKGPPQSSRKSKLASASRSQEKADVVPKRRRSHSTKTHQPGRIPVLGIDPGKSGAIALILPDGELVVTPMPDTPQEIADCLSELRSLGVKEGFIEDTIKFAGNTSLPTSSGVVYGFNGGVCQGALSALKYNVHPVKPREWMKTFTDQLARDLGRTKWKNHLATIARSLYPNNKFTLPEADAVLIAHYGFKQINNLH